MYHNVVVGTPLVEPKELLAYDEQDWLANEQPQTLFTNERSLPTILKLAGVVNSTSEVRKNQPQLLVTPTDPDCIWVKWGKKKVYIIIGE